MKIGLRLPNAAKSLINGPLLVDIARRADKLEAYEAIGCDQLILFMTAPAVEQAELLASSVL